jgi:hypothetical protein
MCTRAQPDDTPTMVLASCAGAQISSKFGNFGNDKQAMAIVAARVDASKQADALRGLEKLQDAVEAQSVRLTLAQAVKQQRLEAMRDGGRKPTKKMQNDIDAAQHAYDKAVAKLESCAATGRTAAVGGVDAAAGAGGAHAPALAPTAAAAGDGAGAGAGPGAVSVAAAVPSVASAPSELDEAEVVSGGDNRRRSTRLAKP